MKRRFLRVNLLLFAVIIALGVVLWYRYYYDPQVAILRAMPKGHHLVRCIDADVDGDNRREIIFSSGPRWDSGLKTAPATVTVLRWQRWRWVKPFRFEGFGTHVFDGEHSLKVEDVNDNGLREIIFQSVINLASTAFYYIYGFGYHEGRFSSLFALAYEGDGGVIIKDFDPARQGKEILFWHDWHRRSEPVLHCNLLAWDGKRYAPYKWAELKETKALSLALYNLSHKKSLSREEISWSQLLSKSPTFTNTSANCTCCAESIWK